MIDAGALRPRFPALSREHNGRPVLYFDNPAGTQVPQETIDGFAHYLQSCNANVHGTFVTSQETDAIIDATRTAVAEFLHVSSGEIVFGANMTSLTFAFSRALGQMLQSGDEIITTRLEHDANVAPWLVLQERGVVIKYIDVNPEDMTLDLDDAQSLFTKRTRLVAAGYASNAFGTVNDIRRLAEMTHEHDAWIFVDAVHYGPHGPINVRDLDVDFLVCSAYKFFGPHLGILSGRRALLEEIPSYHVRPAGDVSPGKWETGTQNHEALSGLLGTLHYLASLAGDHHGDRAAIFTDTMSQIREYECALSRRLIPGMMAIPGITIYGITDPGEFDRRVPTVSFTVEGRDPLDIAAALGAAGIFSWAGDHYAVEPMARLGITATNRVGLAHYNTLEEIDFFLEALDSLARG
jgi:cysteine desulfurase family protein (TIGR01976 family)